MTRLDTPPCAALSLTSRHTNNPSREARVAALTARAADLETSMDERERAFAALQRERLAGEEQRVALQCRVEQLDGEVARWRGKAEAAAEAAAAAREQLGEMMRWAGEGGDVQLTCMGGK